METQEAFDAKIDRANAALESIANSITSEAQQIREFIAALPPEVDTSALDGVVTRLESVAGNVSEIFEPPVDEGNAETGSSESGEGSTD